VRLLVDTWTARNAAPTSAPPAMQKAARWLDLAALWTSAAQVAPLRDALTTGDARAVATLAELEDALESSCAPLLERIAALRRGTDWRSVLSLARLVGGAAAAAGRLPELARALEHEGSALRKLGDDAAAIRAYQGAIQAAPPAGHETFLAQVHEALGDTLDEVLKFEDARRHYGRAAALNADAGRSAQILRKRANELIRLGEYRSAADEFKAQIDAMRTQKVSGIELGRNLDMAAQALLEVGDHAAALAMIREAREHMPAAAVPDLATNFELETRALMSADQPDAAGAAFERAWDLAILRARGQIDPAHYRRGFQTALAARLPQHDEACQLFARGMRDRDSGQVQAAFDNWQRAANRAHQLKDYRLWLRVQSNVVAFLTDRGDTDQAIEVGVRTVNQARERGLARPELMTLATLARLAATGAEVPESDGYVFSYARAQVLLDMHTAMMAEFDLSPLDRSLETGDTGQLESELALLFQGCGLRPRAADCFRRAVAKARAVKSDLLIVNRLCGLVGLLDPEAAAEERRQAVDEIRALAQSPSMPPRGRLVALRTLALEDATADRGAAIAALTAACRLMEADRRTRPVGARSDYDRDFSDIPRLLAAMLRRDGRVRDAFDTQQLVKGRRVIDALVVRAGDATDERDAPLSAGELRGLLPRAGGNTLVVDLVVEPDDKTIAAYLVDAEHVRVVTAAGDRAAFARLNGCDVKEREARLVAICLESAQLRELAEKIVSAAPKDANLLVVPDEFLHQLPLHAIPVRGQAWTDLTPISYAPTAAILRFGHSAVPRHAALIAGDSNGDLEGAAGECIEIGRALGVKPLLGPDCTRAAIEAALHDAAPAIVHLAVHGRGDARFGSRSAVLVADGRGGVEWLEFQVLKALPWSARLVVFSGCSTGAVGLLHGTQLASVAAAALETGVRTVVGSLWPVNDEYARAFMEAFYADLVEALGRGGTVDLRPLLAAGRIRVRGALQAAPQANRRDGRQLGDEAVPDAAPASLGEDVAAALGWAPFCVFGSPLVEFA
jgi:tetratricopeptide (TPR) repeat protein